MIVKPKEIKNIKIHEGQVVGLTSGCFDLPHFYHLAYLQRCAAQCDVLIVGVDADDLVLAQKGQTPAMPEHQRVAMIAEMRCVDAVFTLRSLKDLVLAGQTADILFKNAPTIYGTKIVGAETAKLVIIPDVQEIQSTTQLKQKIKDTTKPQEPNVFDQITQNIKDNTPSYPETILSNKTTPKCLCNGSGITPNTLGKLPCICTTILATPTIKEIVNETLLGKTPTPQNKLYLETQNPTIKEIVNETIKDTIKPEDYLQQFVNTAVNHKCTDPTCTHPNCNIPKFTGLNPTSKCYSCNTTLTLEANKTSQLTYLRLRCQNPKCHNRNIQHTLTLPTQKELQDIENNLITIAKTIYNCSKCKDTKTINPTPGITQDCPRCYGTTYNPPRCPTCKTTTTPIYKDTHAIFVCNNQDCFNKAKICPICQDRKILTDYLDFPYPCPKCDPQPHDPQQKPYDCLICKDTKQILDHQTGTHIPCPHCTKPQNQDLKTLADHLNPTPTATPPQTPKCDKCDTTLTLEFNTTTKYTRHRCKNPKCPYNGNNHSKHDKPQKTHIPCPHCGHPKEPITNTDHPITTYICVNPLCNTPQPKPTPTKIGQCPTCGYHTDKTNTCQNQQCPTKTPTHNASYSNPHLCIKCCQPLDKNKYCTNKKCEHNQTTRLPQ